MKRRFVSILCAATMVASLMTGATVVSAADKERVRYNFNYLKIEIFIKKLTRKTI